MFKELFEKIYYTKTYTINQSRTVLVEKLDSIFLESKNPFKIHSLKGYFRDYPDTFIVLRKFPYIQIFETFVSAATLKGILRDRGPGASELEIAIRPSYFLVFMILLVFILGIANLTLYYFEPTIDRILKAAFLLLIGIPVLIIMTRIRVRDLRLDFENYLDLKG